MMKNYILDIDGNPQLEPDILKWAEWMNGSSHRVLKKDMIGDVLISTVFLGIDHRWNEGPPILWETMIFGTGDDDVYQERYTSLVDALAGHQKAFWWAYEFVEKQKNKLNQTEGKIDDRINDH